MFDNKILEYVAPIWETDAELEACMKKFPGDKDFDKVKKDLASLFKNKKWEKYLNEEETQSDVNISGGSGYAARVSARTPIVTYQNSSMMKSVHEEAQPFKGTACPSEQTPVNLNTFEGPSFDLYISPEKMQHQYKGKGLQIDDVGVRVNDPTNLQRHFEETTRVSRDVFNVKPLTVAQRDKMVSDKLRSPYLDRRVCFEVSAEEIRIQDWVVKTSSSNT